MKVLDDWLAVLRMTKEKATWQSYSYSAKRFVQFLNKRKVCRFREIKPEHILAYQISLRRLRPSAIRRELAALVSLYKWARRNKLTKIVIEDIIEKPKSPPPRVEYLSRKEADQLVLSWRRFPKFMQMRIQCFLYLLYYVGLRIGGIYNLNIEDIDFVHETLRVRMKGGKIRWFPILEIVLDTIKAYITTENRDSGPLFVNKYGDRWSISGMRKMLKKCADFAGIERRIYPHLFRHTFATERKRDGCDIRDIQELLGHEDISSTQIYAHIDVEDLRSKLKESLGRRISEEKKK